MKKRLLLLAALAVSSALCAQETQNFGREDVLAAFKEYNPAALQKAAKNPYYNDLINKLASAYSAPRTEANQNELIALVKNFDNSVRLQAAREEYFNGRTLQTVSGTELTALDERASEQILSVVRGIFDNTIEVKELQIKRYKNQIKAVKKDAFLSKEEKDRETAALKARIKAVKNEMRSLKQDSKQKIQDTALVYFADIRSDFDARRQAVLHQAAQTDLKASQTDARSVKAKNKKPVAK